MHRKRTIPKQHYSQRCKRNKINKNMPMYFPFRFDEHNTSGENDVQDYHELCGHEVDILKRRTRHLLAQVVRNTSIVANEIDERNISGYVVTNAI